ncbi:hypothetical protein GGR50DRAFT_694533 [Xylaria sp. CBS 124048]|nr:hypothetical protein GGR50DRAFT_694533 [Xylaria sp. CBS 124048]
MAFVGIYRAIYNYAPQSEGELSIKEGDLLCVLEKSQDDDWWKAKKKASAADEDEPVGLVPNNYVEEAKPVGHARSLYEYTRQTDEELSFPDDAQLRVYDVSDPDWILVGFESDFGFVPANYIELNDITARGQPVPDPEPEPEPALSPPLPQRPPAPAEPEEPRSPPLPVRPASMASPISPSEPAATQAAAPAATPAAALAGVMQARTATRAPTPPPITIPPRQPIPYIEEPRDEPSPVLPARPRHSSTVSDDQSLASPPVPRRVSVRYNDEQALPSPHVPQRGTLRYTDDIDRSGQFSPLAPGGFHMYNINEMVSIMGKKKKMATTLGVNLKTGIILIAPEKVQDGPTQEWTADKMTHYSREGKHVFLELVRPSKSIDFHAGAKDTAEEIVSALSELSGAMKAEGLREVIAAGTGQTIRKRGQILYDFTAQGDDEVTVFVGDEVFILDDSKSDEWWQIRRLKNGREGVVPSSYVEVLAPVFTQEGGIKSGMSLVAQNRLEEARMTRDLVKKDQKVTEVGPGMRLPDRQSSLSASNVSNISAQQRSRRENGNADSSRSGSKPKPDPSKVRVWTDRSKSFSVEAQFLGLKDGKINLHKLNGVKIAVPLAKMSMEDIEYVERTLGISLDEEKPLADVKRARSMRQNANKAASSASNIGASVEPPKSDYDWFQFFLSCDVAVGLCERYAQAFAKDSMDQSVMPYIDATTLRNLGLREGDIIKVMRYLDKSFGRNREDESGGGLFSGPGGALRNNTRKGRPAPAVQTNDVIDLKALSQKKEGETEPSSLSEEARAKRAKANNSFEDDAWDVKPAKQPESQAKPAPDPEPKAAAPTQAMQDLSLLSTPLEPTKVEPQAPAVSTNVQPPAASQPQQNQTLAQPQGATPSFFSAVSAAQTGPATPAQPLNLGLGGNRQRPQPPQVMGGQGTLMPPPPVRPLSAPQSAMPSGFAPPTLQPQVTGIPSSGPSLNDLNQQRLQQSYMGNFQPQPMGQGYMQVNPTGMTQQPTGFGPQQFMAPQMTGLPQMPGMPQMAGQMTGAPQFSPMPTQPTGFAGNFQPNQQFPQQTGVNAFLPQALEPQRTGIGLQPQQTGFGNFGTGMNQQMNGSLQAPSAPLQPQKTGPAPPVRFGVTPSLAPQPTGRRANLSQATPQNPFGF